MCRTAFLGVIGLVCASLSLPAMGQSAAGNGTGGYGNNGGNYRQQQGYGRQQQNPAAIQQRLAQYQQRMMDNLKTQLGSTDDDFAVLQPRIQTLMQLQQQTAVARPGARQRRMPGVSNISLGAPVDQLHEALTELQAAVSDPTSTASLIGAKLTIYRNARAQARDEVTQAQNDLRQLLTVRQEAILTLTGLLQ